MNKTIVGDLVQRIVTLHSSPLVDLRLISDHDRSPAWLNGYRTLSLWSRANTLHTRGEKMSYVLAVGECTLVDVVAIQATGKWKSAGLKYYPAVVRCRVKFSERTTFGGWRRDSIGWMYATAIKETKEKENGDLHDSIRANNEFAGHAHYSV